MEENPFAPGAYSRLQAVLRDMHLLDREAVRERWEDESTVAVIEKNNPARAGYLEHMATRFAGGAF